MKLAKSPLLLSLAVAPLAACDSSGSAPAGGHPMKVSVAALTIEGVDNTCYDLRVRNQTETVWSMGNVALNLLGGDQTGAPAVANDVVGAADTQTICSDTYGNRDGGDITYIGTCDASSDSDETKDGVQNEVTIWVDGLYKNGADIGDWQDPCPDGCKLSVDCNENADSLVDFNLTVMRRAKQGFFDIAVNFEDVFCSAKVDTCYYDEQGNATGHIELLHGADQVRDWTGVFGFACTAGAGTMDPSTGEVSNPDTNLLYGPVNVNCGEAGLFVIDPTQDEGQYVAFGPVPLHYAIYRGVEDLDCLGGQAAGSCNKKYWNLAFSVDDLEAIGATCTLQLTATANDATIANDPISPTWSAGIPQEPGTSYPYIEVSADLTQGGVGQCQHWGLDSDANDHVHTVYAGVLGGLDTPVTMCSQFNGSVSPTGGCF